MEQLKSKIAVVTGASSGIGASIVRELLSAELIVVGLARRVERVNELKLSLSQDQQARLHAIKCDVSNAIEVAEAFAVIAENYGPVHVLINNAGCLRTGQLCTMPSEQVQEVLLTNVMGVINCTHHAYAAMISDNGDGHVILINSILGHKVPAIPGHLPELNVYPATKYALTAINEIYRQEFTALGTRIKVTSLSPGIVNTELISEEQKSICGDIILQPDDIAKAVMFILSTPKHAQIYELTIKPTGDII
ncbi:farnesol dehydrogenase-like [Teleopsis dalmanni]|uniref:farnesol dehydrogenase-like n=1 Tax=Teleopsis dalmanni TaxID=139649 RepID=UPI0018CD4E59|nr:farnesol dehydrogenase-like [Teleopsis dalmanni]